MESKGEMKCAVHVFGNHLEERLLDQAQAQTPYTPPIGGRSRSIPPGMPAIRAMQGYALGDLPLRAPRQGILLPQVPNNAEAEGGASQSAGGQDEALLRMLPYTEVGIIWNEHGSTGCRGKYVRNLYATGQDGPAGCEGCDPRKPLEQGLEHRFVVLALRKHGFPAAKNMVAAIQILQ